MPSAIKESWAEEWQRDANGECGGEANQYHGETRSRMAFTMESPIPGMARRSSAEVNGGWVIRQSMINLARTSPMPGSSSSNAALALFRVYTSILSSAGYLDIVGRWNRAI